MKSCRISILALAALVLLIGASVPLSTAQLVYQQFFFLKHHASGEFCTVDVDGSGQPMRCDYLVSSVTKVSLTGVAAVVQNRSYIYEESVPVIFNGGALGRWCFNTVKSAYDSNTNMYCSYNSQLPFWTMTKRHDILNEGGPYIWSNDAVDISFKTPATNRTWCGVPSGGSIVRCDYPEPTIDTAFRVLY